MGWLRRLRRSTFALPAFLASCSLAGLGLALFVEGPLDRLGAALLAAPLVAIVLARAAGEGGS